MKAQEPAMKAKTMLEIESFRKLAAILIFFCVVIFERYLLQAIAGQYVPLIASCIAFGIFSIYSSFLDAGRLAWAFLIVMIWGYTFNDTSEVETVFRICFLGPLILVMFSKSREKG